MLISKIKIFSSLCLYLFLNNMVSADSHVLELNWELDGLSNPESVIYDPSLRDVPLVTRLALQAQASVMSPGNSRFLPNWWR